MVGWELIEAMGSNSFAKKSKRLWGNLGTTGSGGQSQHAAPAAAFVLA